ncbi:hypothetical protein F5B18DRAFT_384776 [Nemania serpens]|nr:hypothetical protein F5B18DRAFT_384776 [Nemania serpens]
MGTEFKARRLLFSFWRICSAGEHVIFGIGRTAAHRSTPQHNMPGGWVYQSSAQGQYTIWRAKEPRSRTSDCTRYPEERTSYDSKPAASVPTSCYSDMGEEWGSRSEENIAIPERRVRAVGPHAGLHHVGISIEDFDSNTLRPLGHTSGQRPRGRRGGRAARRANRKRQNESTVQHAHRQSLHRRSARRTSLRPPRPTHLICTDGQSSRATQNGWQTARARVDGL